MSAAVAACPSLVADHRNAVEEARQRFAELEEWIVDSATLGWTFDEVEREHETRGREVLRLLLQAHLDRRGSGEVGAALKVLPRGDGEEARLHSEKRKHGKRIHSVFGEVRASRTAYYAPGSGSIHPLDEQAQLPERTFSYELQRRAVVAGVQGPFDEAVERVEESTGVRLSKRSVEDLMRDAAVDFDAFYAQREQPNPETTGPILVGSLDCKGVPMVKPEQALRVVRRGRGKKANKKRMATVAAVFSQEPRPCTPEEMIERLFYEGPRIKREVPVRQQGPQHKRIWASLSKSKDDVIRELKAELEARNPRGDKILVLLSDGERALQMRAAAAVPGATEVLDIMHAAEKLWKAAYSFHRRESDEAKEWVRTRLLRILQGKVMGVVQGMRQSATKRGLNAQKRAPIEAAAKYFVRNRHRMRYNEFLAAGIPIASGAVEGACKNLVKDRMERSGMRWTIPSADALLQLRAAYLNGDFQDYWRFHMTEDQRRRHPPGRWEVVEK